jgi:proteasome accessory factor B
VATDPLERITNLLTLLLETTLPLTLKQISDRLAGQYPESEAARRTAFERDKALLRAEGIPIDQTVLTGDEAGQTAYRIDRERYELGDFGLTDEERNALQLAVAAVQTGTDWGEHAIWKLGGGGAGSRGRADLEASLPSLPALPVLFQAVADRASVSFPYHGQPRTLDPYSLLARNGRWYLMGRDHGKDDVRTFRVDRMEGAVSVGRPGSFTRPEGFDPLARFPSDPKLMSMGDGDEAVSASVWVSARRAIGVVRELGEAAVEERRADGSVVVRVPCSNPASFRHWVLELLDEAEVLAPDAVRTDFVAFLGGVP